LLTAKAIIISPIFSLCQKHMDGTRQGPERRLGAFRFGDLPRPSAGYSMLLLILIIAPKILVRRLYDFVDPLIRRRSRQGPLRSL